MVFANADYAIKSKSDTVISPGRALSRETYFRVAPDVSAVWEGVTVMGDDEDRSAVDADVDITLAVSFAVLEGDTNAGKLASSVSVDDTRSPWEKVTGPSCAEARCTELDCPLM